MSCAAWLAYSVGTAQDWALHDFMSSFVGEAEPDWVHISENYVHLPIFCLTGQLLYESLTEDSAPMVRTSDCPVISHLLITEFAPLWEQLMFYSPPCPTVVWCIVLPRPRPCSFSSLFTRGASPGIVLPQAKFTHDSMSRVTSSYYTSCSCRRDSAVVGASSD